jgi:non-heme chloroperoxidase
VTKTLLMIHGMWGSGEIWAGYKTYFDKLGYTVITPTLRWHEAKYLNAPPKELGTTSLLDYAADLEKQIGELKEKPIIIGHSMGGLLAQILASRGLAESAILLTPAPPAGVFAFRLSSTRTFLSVLSVWAFWRHPMRPTFNEAKYGIFNQLTPSQQVEEYAKYVYESGQVSFETAFSQLDSNKASAVDAKSVTCPMLIVAGAHDKIVPVSVAKQVVKKYQKSTNVTFKVFKKFGHAIQQQKGWEEIPEYVHDWIRKH